MELATIGEEGNKLVVKISQRLLLNRLLTGSVLSVPWLLLIVAFLFGNKFRSLTDVFRNPLFPYFLLAVVGIPPLLVQVVLEFRNGRAVTFDRQSDGVWYNSRKIAVLSDLQEVKISYSPYRWMVQRRVPVRGMARFLLIPWPSAWIILRNQKPKRVLDTSLLIKMWPPGPPDAMLRGQMKQEAVTVAKRIAGYTGVTLQDDLPVQMAAGWGG